MSVPTFIILITCFASIAAADDFKTINGKEYKDATVSRVEADGIVLRTKGGISKVYFIELPKDVQERFHYEAAKANAYSAAQIAAEATRTQTEATASSASKAAVAPLRQNKTSTTEQVHRIGAVCRDGSESGATGRGACSRHGGVKCWKLSDGICR